MISVRQNVEKVPLLALITGACSMLFPFVALKENRIVEGDLMRGWELTTPLLAVFAVALACAILYAAFRTSGQTTKIICAAAGFSSAWLAAILLSRAGSLMPAGNIGRMSPTLGFWGLPVASYILMEYSGLFRSGWRFWFGLLLWLVPSVLILWGESGQMISVLREWSVRQDRFLDELVVHFRLFISSVLMAAVLGVPLGVWAMNRVVMKRVVVGAVDVMQTVPSMALFGLLVAPMAWLSRALPVLRTLGIGGIGMAPAIIALTMYALLPIVRNTIAGLEAVPASTLEAGRVMGMSRWQLFFQVEWPQALPYLLTGIRTASVQAVGNAAVAALIGAGGLGVMIFQGLGQAAPDLILLGVIPLIFIAVVVDRFWIFLIDRTLSPGLKLYISREGTV